MPAMRHSTTAATSHPQQQHSGQGRQAGQQGGSQHNSRAGQGAGQGWAARQAGRGPSRGGAVDRKRARSRVKVNEGVAKGHTSLPGERHTAQGNKVGEALPEVGNCGAGG